MVGALPTYLLTVAYDGTRFHGWQRQPGVRTVQEELERACAAIDLPDTHVEGAGRTDTGVHALGQCAHIRTDRDFPPDKLQLALNSNLPEDVAVRRSVVAPDGFHARFFAGGKRYLYRVVCSSVKPAVGRPYFHWSRRAVDIAAMRRSMQCLRGEHDFASFATNPGYERSRGTVRTLHHLHIVRRREGFDFVVQGSGFLYNMVRNLVGTLLEVGLLSACMAAVAGHRPGLTSSLPSARASSATPCVHVGSRASSALVSAASRAASMSACNLLMI